MPAAAGLFLPTVGTSATCDALPGAMARAPIADAERQLIADPAAPGQEQDHVSSANMERLDENHRADDDDYASGSDSEFDRNHSWDDPFDEWFQDYNPEDLDGPRHTRMDPKTMPSTLCAGGNRSPVGTANSEVGAFDDARRQVTSSPPRRHGARAHSCQVGAACVFHPEEETGRCLQTRPGPGPFQC